MQQDQCFVYLAVSCQSQVQQMRILSIRCFQYVSSFANCCIWLMYIYEIFVICEHMLKFVTSTPRDLHLLGTGQYEPVFYLPGYHCDVYLSHFCSIIFKNVVMYLLCVVKEQTIWLDSNQG